MGSRIFLTREVFFRALARKKLFGVFLVFFGVFVIVVVFGGGVFVFFGFFFVFRVSAIFLVFFSGVGMSKTGNSRSESDSDS